MGSVKKKVATLFLPNMSFLAELQQLIIFIRIQSSFNTPEGSLQIIHQIRSKGFLAIKTLDPPPFFSYQITVLLFGKPFGWSVGSSGLAKVVTTVHWLGEYYL
jgi:hypothetical protein